MSVKISDMTDGGALQTTDWVEVSRPGAEPEDPRLTRRVLPNASGVPFNLNVTGSVERSLAAKVGERPSQKDFETANTSPSELLTALSASTALYLAPDDREHTGEMSNGLTEPRTLIGSGFESRIGIPASASMTSGNILLYKVDDPAERGPDGDVISGLHFDEHVMSSPPDPNRDHYPINLSDRARFVLSNLWFTDVNGGVRLGYKFDGTGDEGKDGAHQCRRGFVTTLNLEDCPGLGVEVWSRDTIIHGVIDAKSNQVTPGSDEQHFIRVVTVPPDVPESQQTRSNYLGALISQNRAANGIFWNWHDNIGPKYHIVNGAIFGNLSKNGIRFASSTTALNNAKSLISNVLVHNCGENALHTGEVADSGTASQLLINGLMGIEAARSCVRDRGSYNAFDAVYALDCGASAHPSILSTDGKGGYYKGIVHRPAGGSCTGLNIATTATDRLVDLQIAGSYGSNASLGPVNISGSRHSVRLHAVDGLVAGRGILIQCADSRIDYVGVVPATRLFEVSGNGNHITGRIAGNVEVSGDNNIIDAVITGTITNTGTGNVFRGVLRNPDQVLNASAGDGNSTIITGMEFGKTYEIRIEETTAFDGDTNTTFRVGTAAAGDEFLADVTLTGTTVRGLVISGTEHIGQNVVVTWANNASASAGALTVTVVVK